MGCRCVSFAQAGSRLDERIEHGLEIKGGAADYLEDVGGGGLLPQRLPQFVKQSRVLHGVLHQRDLLIGEWAHLLAEDADEADQLAVHFLSFGKIVRTDAAIRKPSASHLTSARFGLFAASSRAPCHGPPQGSELCAPPAYNGAITAGICDRRNGVWDQVAQQQSETAHVHFGSKADIGWH